MREIILAGGQIAKVDDDDFEKLKSYKYCLSSHGYAQRNICVSGKWTTVSMHRDVMGTDKSLIDHIDGNPLNNTKENLRIANYQLNARNAKSKSGTVSKFKGVTYVKESNKWRVRICINGRNKQIGYFRDEIEAAKAYDDKAFELFGEFARLNFPRNEDA
jgi:hypothetical protein